MNTIEVPQHVRNKLAQTEFGARHTIGEDSNLLQNLTRHIRKEWDLPPIPEEDKPEFERQTVESNETSLKIVASQRHLAVIRGEVSVPRQQSLSAEQKKSILALRTIQRDFGRNRWLHQLVPLQENQEKTKQPSFFKRITTQLLSAISGREMGK